MEMDNEVSGTGNQYDYGFRIYNPRIAKFLSIDPLTKSYPMLTPYQFASNTPIWAIDLDGLEALTVSTVFTASFGGSAFIEKGAIFDFSKPKLQIYTYATTGQGVESNASLALEGTVGYYPSASV
jgi:RHS repeat-associated protein